LPVACRAQARGKCLSTSGFVNIRIGPPADTFGGAGGESKARLFKVYGYAFLAHKSS
jgi:hypothetical protein